MGPAGSGWFIEPKSGVINADGADLEDQAADDVRGLVCHEAAHAAVTRYLHLVPPAELRRPGMAPLLNALEDCRIETWLAARLPGTAPWIALYNDRLFPGGGEAIGALSWMEQFCLGAVHHWWHGELPPSLADEPRAALEQTAAARMAVVDAQPPLTADVPLADTLIYEQHPVHRRFATRDRYAPPDGFERLVRVRAYEAWRVTWLDVRPVYLELVRRDLAHAKDMEAIEKRLLARLRALRHGAPPRSPRRRVVPLPASLGAPPPSTGELEPAPSTDRVAPLSPALRQSLEQQVQAAPTSVYEEARRDVHALSDRLFAQLERVLRPASYPRWLDGFPSGARVDLRVAMTAEVEPGAHTRMWQRKTLPVRRDPAVLLLLDLSGSMAGEPIHHGFRGTVLLAEVLERLRIPFAVYGFQDVLLPFKDFGAALDPITRRRMGGMPDEVLGSHRGGHNRPEHNWDGPVLRSAGEALLAWPARDRLLLVVSDGEPSGPANAEVALQRAIADVSAELSVVGIGLGPNTNHVLRFYPDAIADIPLEHFPEALGALLARLVGQPVQRAAGGRR